MDQADHLGCNSLQARGLLRVGPEGSDTKDKCFKGLGLVSRANVEIEEEDLELLPSKAKEHQELATWSDGGNFSDSEAATTQGSSVNGEENKQTVEDSRALVDIVKCSLEGEISREWAMTLRSTFGTGVARREHTEEATRGGREKAISDGSWRSTSVASGMDGGCRSGKRDDIRALIRTPTRDS
ncbi:hypothetical protein AAC387_Pa08g2637 [Persea americana]